MCGHPAQSMTCPECEGGGMLAKLYPQGHTEVTCEYCEGTGYLDEEEPVSSGKCECGADAVGGGIHSSWCPLS